MIKRSHKPIQRTAIKARSKPIKAKRAAVRRGRLVDRKFLQWAATQPCCVTGEFPATSHHVRECGSPKNDRRIIRLVARLHLHEAGMESIERLGKEKFQERFGIDIEQEIARLNNRYAG